MKPRAFFATLTAFVLVTTTLGCGKPTAPEPAAPATTTAAAPAAPAPPPAEPAADTPPPAPETVVEGAVVK